MSDQVNRLTKVLQMLDLTHTAGMTVQGRKLYPDDLRIVLARASEPVPADVARLVVAARIVAHEDQGPVAMDELDRASEAFADRVRWDDEPERETP